MQDEKAAASFFPLFRRLMTTSTAPTVVANLIMALVVGVMAVMGVMVIVVAMVVGVMVMVVAMVVAVGVIGMVLSAL